MSKFFKIETKMVRNGISYPYNPKKVKASDVRKAIAKVVAMDLMNVYQDTIKSTFSFLRAHQRKLVNGETMTLLKAYEETLKESQFAVDGQGAKFKILDMAKMDKRLPYHGPNRAGKKGWWRLYEFGSPGKSNSEYVFVPTGKNKNPNLWDIGRHGEGVMIRKDRLKGYKGMKHPGLPPFRIIRTMQMKFREKFNINTFKERVMGAAMIAITRGA
jgi:hypothetical protein